MLSIFAFSGSIGSGKSTLSVELSKKISCKYASFGNYVRKQAISNGYANPTRAYLQEIGEGLVINGIKDFCEAVVVDSGWQRGESLVVDGVRHLDALENLRSIFYPQKLYLIYLEIDEKTRVERLSSRDKDDVEVDQNGHSTEVQVGRVLKEKADFIIDASDTVINNIRIILKHFGDL